MQTVEIRLEIVLQAVQVHIEVVLQSVQAYIEAGVSIFQLNCKTTGVNLVILANCLVHGGRQTAYYKGKLLYFLGLVNNALFLLDLARFN